MYRSGDTINWPLTGGVHLFPGRVMGLSQEDNGAGRRPAGGPDTAPISHTTRARANN